MTFHFRAEGDFYITSPALENGTTIEVGTEVVIPIFEPLRANAPNHGPTGPHAGTAFTISGPPRHLPTKCPKKSRTNVTSVSMAGSPPPPPPGISPDGPETGVEVFLAP